MILSDLLADLYERLNYPSSPAAAVTTRLTRALNTAQRRILREPGLSRLKDTGTGLTFASVASQAFYGLPASIGRVRAITDRTNDRLLSPVSLLELRAADPGLSASGTPSAYVGLGFKPIKALPAATGLWAASSSAADAAGPTIQINGVRSGGYASGDIVTTLTGVTRVALGTFTDYVDVQSISLSAACAGLITVYDAAANGTALAEIPIGAQYPQYVCVHLYPIPSAAITYYVDGAMRMPDMDDATDTPVLPEEFHDLLIAGALITEYEHQEDPRLVHAVRTYDKGLSRLKHSLHAGDAPILGGSTRPSLSRLGSWTPAGT